MTTSGTDQPPLRSLSLLKPERCRQTVVAAETTAPNPYITQWCEDLPFIYEKGNCAFWQPETISNFETTLHALYLGIRMAWNPKQDPRAIVDEINRNFYGHAAPQMAAYWDYIDHVWIDCPEYAGCGFGHLRRWTPEKLAGARQLLDAGVAAAQTDDEKYRIQIAAESLTAFDAFMKLRRDPAEVRRSWWHCWHCKQGPMANNRSVRFSDMAK